MRVKISILRWGLVFLFIQAICFAQSGGSTAVIKGNLKQTGKGDSFTVFAYKYGMEEISRRYVVAVKDGNFKVTVNEVQGPLYIRIKLPGNYSSPEQKYLIEPGDIVQISEANNKLEYSGIGAFKFKCRDSLNNIYKENYSRKWKDVSFLSITPSKPVYQYLDSIGMLQLNYLLRCRNKLSQGVFNLTKIDILSAIELNKDVWLLYSNFRKDSTTNSLIKTSLADYRNKIWQELLKITKEESKATGYSAVLYQCILSRYKIDSFVFIGKTFSLSQFVDYSVKNYSGLLLEKLITNGIYLRKNQEGAALASIIAKTTDYIKKDDFKSFIAKINSNNTAGSKAYNFLLSDVNGKMHQLSDYRNKVVVMDFWFTGCANCIVLNSKLKKIEALFSSDSNLVFISISKDRNKEQWVKSVKDGKYTTDNRVNLYSNGLGDSYPMFSYYSISGYPTILTIDQNGRLCENALDPRLDDGKSLIGVIEKHLKDAADTAQNTNIK